MTNRVSELSYPPPRGLRSLLHVRRELTTVYREAKSGLIEPPLFGKLVHALNVLQALDNGRMVDARLTALEAKLAGLKANGSAGRPTTRAAQMERRP